MSVIPDNPKDATEALILQLAEDYYPWYERSMERNSSLWIGCQFFALIAGFGTSLLAALDQGSMLSAFGIFPKWLLVILPFAGSTASTILVQSKVLARFQLREKGRVDIQTLISEGKGKFAAAQSDQDYIELHKFLRNTIEQVEREQVEGFFKHAPSFTGS